MFKSRLILFLSMFLFFSALSAQIIPPTNLQSDLNSSTGEVELSWNHGSAGGFYEDFEDGVADNWYPLEGDWSVANGLYSCTRTTTSYTSSYYDEEFSNLSIEVEMCKREGSNNLIGFYFNGDPSDPGSVGKWNNAYRMVYGFSSNIQQWNFSKYVNGSWTNISGWNTSVNIHPTSHTMNVVKVVYVDGNIDIYINGVLEATYFDNEFPSGKIGLLMYGSEGDIGDYEYVSVENVASDYVHGEIDASIIPELYPDGSMLEDGYNTRGEHVVYLDAPAPDNTREFLYFNVYRDGNLIAQPTDKNYIDQLPEYGTYNYEVTAVYDEGESDAAGPETVNWQADYLWLAEITVADAGGADVGQMMEYGRHPFATDGIDTTYGEIELPPPPPAGAFDARFVFPDGVTQSLRDIRGIDDEEVMWTINYQPGPSGFPITLSWDPSMLPEGSFMLKDSYGVGLVNVNMKQQSSVTISNTSVTSVIIEHSMETTSSFNTFQGWNMISVPVEAEDMAVSAVFPDASSSAFKFNNGYVPVDMLELSVGYWIKFDDVLTHNITGMPVPGPIAVAEGWNLIGPHHMEITAADIVTNPTGILASQFFEFNDGYYTADILEPGKGYWVKTSGAGELLYPLPTKKGPAEYYEELAAFYAIDVEVNDGYAGYNINGGIDPAATDGIDADLGEAELPPAPPAGIFDARMILPDGITSSFQDYRNGDAAFNGIHEHILKWQLGAGDTLWLHVSIPEVSGTVHLHAEDPFGGAFVSADQYDGTSNWYYVDNSALTQLNITLSYTAPIPVELTSFTASVSGEQIRLDWETATETNNKGFDILRSNDNNRFEKIGFVDGNGTSSEPHSYNFVDYNAKTGTYYYRLKQIDFDGSESYSDIIEVDFMPAEFSLGQNYPNPFNPSTKIKFALPVDSKVTLSVYNIVGQNVATLVNETISAGLHEAGFNASDLSSGVYFYVLNAEGTDGRKFSETKKLMLMK